MNQLSEVARFHADNNLGLSFHEFAIWARDNPSKFYFMLESEKRLR